VDQKKKRKKSRRPIKNFANTEQTVYTENDTSMTEEYGTTGSQQIEYSKLTLEGFTIFW
jgi:hypothetical protein